MRVRKQILIVGNDADFRKELDQKLHKAGYQVFQAMGEDAALELVKDIKIDLVFLAQRGSESSQEEFFYKLRRTFLGQDVRLLMIPPSEKGMSPLLKRDKKVEYLASWPMKPADIFLQIDKVVNRGLPKIAQYKILVAGTDDEVIDDITRQLQSENYQVQYAVSGSETITKAVQMVPDLLIMDILIDGVPASDIIRILRQMPQFDKKPVVLYCFYRISDLGREDVRERVLSIEVEQMRCKEAGEYDYIGRYNENALLPIINRYFS